MELLDRVFCRFCLGCDAHNLITLNDLELTTKIVRVFYFEITFPAPSRICGTCKLTIEEFYQYSERVERNQERLREKRNTEAIEQPNGSSIERRRSDSNGEDLNTKDVPAEVVDVSESDWVLDQEPFSNPLDPDHLKPVDSVLVTEHTTQTTIDTEEISPRTVTRRVGYKKRQATEGTDLTPDQLVLQHHELSCDLCSVTLTDFNELRRHFKQVHNVPGYIRCCNRVFRKRCWMIEHLQLHLNPDTFQCGQCTKSYSSSKVLKEHMKEVHAPAADRRFACAHCRKTFVSKAHLNAHIMVAHGSVPCPQCEKVLASQGSLRKHLLAMHGEGEKHVCEVCARVFRSKQCFETHLKDHQGRRSECRVQCEICAVWLVDKYCLTKHMRRMHTQTEGRMTLSCATCGKVARNRDALACHIRRAHRESRFDCERCHKRFTRPHHMREHIAIHHTGEDLYGCLHCSERFNTKNKQYFHRKTVHPQEYEMELRKRALKE